MVNIVSGGDRDPENELEILYEDGMKYLNLHLQLTQNWEVNWVDKVMSRLDSPDIIEFLGNKPNPKHRGPPVAEPEVIREYLERLRIIIDRS